MAPPLNVSAITLANIAASATATDGAAVLTRPIRVDGRGIGSERFGAGKRALLRVDRGTSEVAGTMAAPIGTVAVYGADLPNGLGAVGAGSSVLGNAYVSASTPTMQLFAGDNSTTRFQTNIPFTAFSNYNWVVETSSFKLTGTVAVAAGVVTGTGTDFNPEIDVGDELMLGGQLCVVTARTSDTAAVVTPAITVSAGAAGYNLAQNKWVKEYNDTEGTNPALYAVDDVGGYAVIDFGVAPPSAVPSGVTAYGANVSNIAVYKVTPTEILASGVNAGVLTGIRSRTVMWVSYAGGTGDDFSSARVHLEVSTAS